MKPFFKKTGLLRRCAPRNDGALDCVVAALLAMTGFRVLHLFRGLFPVFAAFPATPRLCVRHFLPTPRSPFAKSFLKKNVMFSGFLANT